jgi:3-hydroxymyristoyl/3-hydroxydecanoyl-(acyl carrier protein) dehydratase
MNTNPMTAMQRLSWRLRHDFNLVLVANVLDRLIKNERTAVESAAEESVKIESTMDIVTQDLHAALTDPVTPGVITIEEARQIVGHVVDMKGITHTHTQNLKALAS